ncbi:MAG: MarR family transcriptional regulator [Clostridia bacterium]|nr:MarR family transcriptional regulator [Clostridia bacterium]
MLDYTALTDLFFDNIKKLFYPEEWITLDLTLSKSEIFTMLLTDRHGEVIMSQLAEHIGVPMSTATGVVERLVKAGYIKRERSESDRRIVVIKLTDNGQELVDKLKSNIYEYLQLIYDALTEEERQLLGKIFFKVFDILNERMIGKTNESDEKKQIRKIEID